MIATIWLSRNGCRLCVSPARATQAQAYHIMDEEMVVLEYIERGSMCQERLTICYISLSNYQQVESRGINHAHKVS